MSIKIIMAGIFALTIAVLGDAPAARSEIQFPKTSKTNADAATLKEFNRFYEEIEKALQEENISKIMSFYADDYLHHGITKKQLKFMWLEVFANFEELYSVHVFTKITAHGKDAILVCTGGLFGVANKGEDYTTVDQWVTHNHWLSKVNGEWKMVGGATHQSPRKRGSRLELHPFF